MFNISVPPKMEYLNPPRKLRTRQDWLTRSQEISRSMNKEFRKSRDKRSRMTAQSEVQKRQVRTAVNSVPGLMTRVRKMNSVSDEEMDVLVNNWIRISHIPFLNYNDYEKDYYLVCAAAIWILDQIEAEDTGIFHVREFLPRDEKILDEYWRMPEMFDCRYDEDFLMSVVWTICHRNDDTQPVSMDEEDIPEVLLSDTIALEDYREDGPFRKNFEGMLALIPEEKKDRAAAHFLEAADNWINRYLTGEIILVKKDAAFRQKINEMVDKHNRLRDEVIGLDKRIREKEKLARRTNSQKNKQPTTANPLLMNPPPANPEQDMSAYDRFMKGLNGSLPFPDNGAVRRVLTMGNVSEDPDGAEYDRLVSEIIKTNEQFNRMLDEWYDFQSSMGQYSSEMLSSGMVSEELSDLLFDGKAPEKQQEMQHADPFEMCFGLLYLLDRGDDGVWMMSACESVVLEIAESLPWAFYEYDEIEDPVRNDRGGRMPTAVRTDTVKDVYERKYVSGDAGYPQFKRSFAQILYEETGCVLPRDMHTYDQRESALKKEYGLGKSDARIMLYLMNTAGKLCRRIQASNLDPEFMELCESILGKEKASGEPEEKKREQPVKPEMRREELEQELNRVRDENARLRKSLYETEHTARGTRKELAAVRQDAEREHRELADLREVVFNQSENAEDHPEEEEAANDGTFPYEVRKETLVFGGHATWLKAIKQMLTGRIRFIDKDLVFDTGIVRHADTIWIQPNALSHSQYYRIMDAVRVQKKTVRYFTNASAARGAKQVMENDRE